MKDLIARQLYQPAVVLPLLLLTRLMVSLDFNLAQVMFVMLRKGGAASISLCAAPRDLAPAQRRREAHPLQQLLLRLARNTDLNRPRERTSHRARAAADNRD
ncbi:hypothetical protein BPUN_2772 [Candidatus Paraburkholderia kirkii]|nr:hypothetical protein BPUN_2772 [Candidatus Paraburkholderia kirkii]